MISTNLTLQAGGVYKSHRDPNGNGPIQVDLTGGWRHTLNFESVQALEEFYDFLSGVMAGIRFDAMEQVDIPRKRLTPAEMEMLCGNDGKNE